MEKIIISDITKRFGEKTVLDHFSLEIEKGGIFLIMGASGCGKTTLLRIMTGLEKADEGKVEGVELDKISFVFQEDRLIDHLSALSNAVLPLKSDANARKAGMEVLALLGLAGEEKKRARNLSGGMARRVSIARAMLKEADIVFMDEPFKGLDKDTKEKTISFVKKYAEGKTLIVVTHSQSEAELLGGSVYKMPVSDKNFEEKGEKM